MGSPLPLQADPQGELQKGFTSTQPFNIRDLENRATEGVVEVESPKGVRYGFTLGLPRISDDRIQGYLDYSGQRRADRFPAPDGIRVELFNHLGRIGVKRVPV